MTKKILRMIGIVMLVAAIAFVVFALNHPEMSFPWSNTISYIIYGGYLLIMIFLLIAPIKRK